jgi:VanZ family protein
MAGIFVVSGLQELPGIPGGVSDKTGHFAAYAGLGALVLRARAGSRWSGVTTPAAVVAWVVCVGYGASDELHQAFVPGRTAALDDVVADAAGAAASIGVLLVVAARIRRRAGAI